MADDMVRASEAIFSRKNARVESDTPDSSANSKENEAQGKQPPQRRRHGYLLRLSFIFLVLVLMASGLVPLGDVLFAGFASVYFLAIGKLVYPSPTKENPPSVFPRNSWVGPYVAFAGVISIPIPAVYILGCFAKGDQAAVKSASPHLFLMTCQVLTEIVLVSMSTPVSLPVRAFVPIVYNTRRLFTIAAWLETELARAVDDTVGLRWILLGRGLAAANITIWTFNLFCFMLPVYHPMVMRKHYELERQLSREHQT